MIYYQQGNLKSGTETAENKEGYMKAMAQAVCPVDETTVIEAAQARAMFEAATQRYLHMSAEEFLKRWDSGLSAIDPDQNPGLRNVVALLPLVR